MITTKKIDVAVMWVIISIIFILTFLVLKDILLAIIIGFLFAYVFHPLYDKINKKIKKPNLTTWLLIFLILLLFAAPLIYFTPMIINQTFTLYGNMQEVDIAGSLQSTFPSLLDEQLTNTLRLNINNVLSKVVSLFMSQFTNLLVNLANIILQTFVFLFTFYYALRDGDKLSEYFIKLSPFSKSTDKKFKNEFRGITNSIMMGQVLIGIIQGLALGVCLLILGVPNVLVLSFLTMIICIIPVLGAFLVWLPVTIFLFISGDITSAIILVLYGGLFVSNIDNILRPYFLSKSSRLPISIGLAGTIGGLYFIGIAGLIIGPLILAYALIIIEFYREGRLIEISKKHH